MFLSCYVGMMPTYRSELRITIESIIGFVLLCTFAWFFGVPGLVFALIAFILYIKD